VKEALDRESWRGAGRARRRGPRLRSLPLRMLIPNIMTVLALCAGLTSMRLGIDRHYELATIAVLVAAALDGLDGRLARLLRGATRFGAELDSLTDFVNFGVAPVLLLYSWTLSGLGGLGWIEALAYSVCCALRLARCNTALDDVDRPAWHRHFFVGAPAPAGALLAMLPLYLSFVGFDQLRGWPLVVAIYLGVIAFLMISRLPTFSGKGARIRRDYVLPLLLVIAVGTALLVSYTWMTLSCMVAAYFALLPLSHARFRRYERDDEAKEGATHNGDGVEDDGDAGGDGPRYAVIERPGAQAPSGGL
jgi:CDP-diacylglycerol--serine O-phosphatidyltransferase